MLPFISLPDLSAVYAKGINRLLAREPWAAQRLAGHAGKTVRFVIGQVSLQLLIGNDGRVQAAPRDTSAHVTLTLPGHLLGSIPGRIMQSGGKPADIAALMHVEGDAGLANVVSGLANDLRWDIEHELASVVGDVPAMRLLALGQAAARGAQAAAGRLSENVAEFLTQETDLMVSRQAFNDWAREIAAIQTRLAGLEHRVSLVGRPLAGRQGHRA